MSQVLHKTTLGRASRTLGQLWQVPTFLAGVLAFAFVAVSAPLRQDPHAREFDEDLNQLRQALNQKRDKAQTHVAMAERLLERATRYPHKAGEVHYLAGTLFSRLANEGAPEQAGATRDKAIKHLEEALSLNVPEPDLPFLQYRLGVLLYTQGGDLRRVIQLLSHSVEQQPPDQRAPGYGMLVQAYLKLPQPQLDAALDANDNHITHMGDEEEPLFQAWLLRGELLLKRERRPEALQCLDRLAKAPRQYRVPARLLQIRCCEEDENWRKAIPLWQDLLPEASKVEGGKGRILYAIGLCNYKKDSPDYEAARQAWEEARTLGADEGQAANLRLAELLLFGAKADPGAALARLSEALKHVPTPQDYRNGLIDIESVRKMFNQALERYRGDASMHRNLAELYKHVAPAGGAQMFMARAAEELARDWLKKLPADERDPRRATVLAEARNQFRQAGDLYEVAARDMNKAEKTDALWRSAQCFMPAEEFGRAISVLQRFVKMDSTDRLKSQAYLDLGDAHRQLKQADLATEAYLECIRIPQTAYAVRARYQLALIQIEQNKQADARENLAQILTQRGPGVDRETLELALFKLGDLLFNTARRPEDFDAAQWRLKEALDNHPFSPQIWRVRDQLGFCYRQQARYFGDQHKATNDPNLLGQRNKLLNDAVTTYQPLAVELQNRYEKGQLVENEAAWLRRTHLVLAQLYIDLERHQDAFDRGRNLVLNFRKTKEGLEAFDVLDKCMAMFETISDPGERSRYRKEYIEKCVAAALYDLNSMPDNHPVFVETGRQRQQWVIDMRRRGSPAPASRPN